MPVPQIGRIEWAMDVARAKLPRRRPRGTAEPSMLAFAHAAKGALLDPQVHHAHIRRTVDAAIDERVGAPRKYLDRDENKSLTSRIRSIAVDVCLDKVRRGDVGHSWRGQFAPAAVVECIPLILPLFGSALWWFVGAFVKWLLLKLILFAIEAMLEKLAYSVPGAADDDADPRAVIEAWAAMEGVPQA